MLAPLFWAGNFIVGRAAHDILTPIELNFYRWALVVVISLPFGLKGIITHKAIIIKELPNIILISFLSVSLYSFMIYEGLSSASAFNGGLYTALIPVLMILLTTRKFSEHHQMIYMGTIIAFIGSVVVATRGDLTALTKGGFHKGDVWLILSTFVWVFYTIRLKNLYQIDSFSLFCLTAFFGVILFSPALFFIERDPITLMADRQVLLSLLYISFFPSLLSYSFWTYGLKKTSPVFVGNFIYLLPVYTVILAVFVLGEAIKTYHIIGGGFIVSGLILTVSYGLKKSEAQAGK